MRSYDRTRRAKWGSGDMVEMPALHTLLCGKPFKLEDADEPLSLSA